MFIFKYKFKCYAIKTKWQLIWDTSLCYFVLDDLKKNPCCLNHNKKGHFQGRGGGVKKEISHANIKILIFIENKSFSESLFGFLIQKSFLIWNSDTS